MRDAFDTVDKRIRIITLVLVALFSIAFGLNFIYLANGQVINNFPYITQDGFDWYTEGIYLVESFKAKSLPHLNVLRPPVFVFITAGDYLLGEKGYLLALVAALSIFCTYYFSLKLLELSKPAGDEAGHTYAIFPLAIALILLPINFFKVYLLSDNLAVTLSIISVFLFMQYFKQRRLGFLVAATAVGTIGGLTQTYALIPFLVAVSLALAHSMWFNKKISYQLVIALITPIMIFLIATYLWRLYMPHGTTPANFILLKFSTDMWHFYINTWGFYYLLFIVFFMVYYRFKVIWNTTDFLTNTSLVLVASFSCLCFFYQITEARISYYFWPWLMISLFAVIRIRSIRGWVFLSALMLFSVLLVPANYWMPSFQSASLSWEKNWVVGYFSTTPVNRGFNNCQSPCELTNDFLKNSDSYVNSSVKIYREIRSTPLING